MKNTIKNLVRGILKRLFRTSWGGSIIHAFIDDIMDAQCEVRYQGHTLFFSIPNTLNKYRVDTFATKEPDTLEWIDSIPEKSTLWDIGANIGLYSVYAAKTRQCFVYAFEPSVFNLELLARNIFINKLQSNITIIPVALSDKVGLNTFKMTSTAWGGALSTFGESFDQHGNQLNEVFEYKTAGLSMTDAIPHLGIPPPDYIKIDVDGLEHFILRGGADVLKKAQSVLIEIDDNFQSQAAETGYLLANAGLSLYKKCDLGVPTSFNQWWVREKTISND